jgi:tRNA pseudouridine55 synthase
VNAAELKALQNHKAVPLRPVESPRWALPAGFPDPHAPIRALHDDSLVAMLRERAGALVGAPVLRAPL